MVEVGAGVTSVKAGDHVIPLYIPECGECKFCRSGTHQSLPAHSRSPKAKGVMPDGTSRFTLGAKTIFHYMGTSTLFRIYRAAGNRRGENQSGCAAGQGLPARLRHHHRHRRGVEYRESAAGLDRRRVRPRRHRTVSVIQGLVMAKAERIIAVDTNHAKFEMAKTSRRHRFHRAASEWHGQSSK